MTTTYYYKGISQEGSLIKATIQTKNLIMAKNELTSQNILLLKIHRQTNFTFNFRPQKITAKLITDFTRQLATMINSGISIISALNIIEQSAEHQQMQKLISSIRMELESGVSLSTAFSGKSSHIDELFCQLLFAGEQSGTMDIMLNYLANYRERSQTIKRKIKKALFYPLAILSVAVIVTGLLLILVIPQFADLYKSFGAQLPAYTQFIIFLANKTKTYGAVLAIVFTSLIVSLKIIYKNSLKTALFFDKLILRLPGFGILIKKAILVRFNYILAITCKAGLPLREALNCVSNIVDNKIYQQATFAICEKVIAGQPINASLNDDFLFPKRVKQMIIIGEESGSLDSMLLKIADFYEAELTYAIDNLNNLLEPMIMIILGIIIGSLIIGMYLPIFRLGTVL